MAKLIVVDVESDGGLLGVNSMVCFGGNNTELLSILTIRLMMRKVMRKRCYTLIHKDLDYFNYG